MRVSLVAVMVTLAGCAGAKEKSDDSAGDDTKTEEVEAQEEETEPDDPEIKPAQEEPAEEPQDDPADERTYVVDAEGELVGYYNVTKNRLAIEDTDLYVPLVSYEEGFKVEEGPVCYFLEEGCSSECYLTDPEMLALQGGGTVWKPRAMKNAWYIEPGDPEEKKTNAFLSRYEEGECIAMELGTPMVAETTWIAEKLCDFKLPFSPKEN